MCVALPVYPVAEIAQQGAAHVMKMEIPSHSHLHDHSHVHQVKLFHQIGTIVAFLAKFTTLTRLVACH